MTRVSEERDSLQQRLKQLSDHKECKKNTSGKRLGISYLIGSNSKDAFGREIYSIECCECMQTLFEHLG